MLLTTTSLAQEWDLSPIHRDIMSEYLVVNQMEFPSPEDIRKWNQETEAALARLSIPESRTSSRVSTVTMAQASDVLESIQRSRVISNISKYDPKGDMGFCFGRAFYYHLELLRRGVHKDSIRKVFVIGNMQAYGMQWRYHVATSVRSADGSWIVLDNLIGKPVTIEKWFEKYQKFSLVRHHE
jgi:hypothetical protein